MHNERCGRNEAQRNVELRIIDGRILKRQHLSSAVRVF